MKRSKRTERTKRSLSTSASMTSRKPASPGSLFRWTSRMLTAIPARSRRTSDTSRSVRGGDLLGERLRRRVGYVLDPVQVARGDDEAPAVAGRSDVRPVRRRTSPSARRTAWRCRGCTRGRRPTSPPRRGRRRRSGRASPRGSRWAGRFGVLEDEVLVGVDERLPLDGLADRRHRLAARLHPPRSPGPTPRAAPASEPFAHYGLVPETLVEADGRAVELVDVQLGLVQAPRLRPVVGAPALAPCRCPRSAVLAATTSVRIFR